MRMIKEYDNTEEHISTVSEAAALYGEIGTNVLCTDVVSIEQPLIPRSYSLHEAAARSMNIQQFCDGLRATADQFYKAQA